MRAIVFDSINKFLYWWEAKQPNATFLPFQHPRIMQIWQETIGTASGTECYAVRIDDDEGMPLLVVFLALRRSKRFGLRTLSFMDWDLIDYNAPVLFEPFHSIAASPRDLWKLIRAALPPHDLVTLKKIPASIKGHPNPLWASEQRRHYSSGHAMTLPYKWETVELEKANHELMKGWKRKLRRLNEQGAVLFTMAETPSERQEVLDVLIAQRHQRFKEMNLFNVFDKPNVEAFYRECAKSTNSEITYLSALKVDSTIVAANFGFKDTEQLIFLLTSFAGDRWARFSTGQLHMRMLLEWATIRGLRQFDFGAGDEEYKMFWCDQHTDLRDIQETTSLGGRIYLYAHKMYNNANALTRLIARRSRV